MNPIDEACELLAVIGDNSRTVESEEIFAVRARLLAFAFTKMAEVPGHSPGHSPNTTEDGK